MIFGYAYPKCANLKLITKDERELKQLLRNNTYIRQPFLAYVVTKFLISKACFVAAVQVWISVLRIQRLTHPEAHHEG